MIDPMKILQYHAECPDYVGLNLRVAEAMADRNNQSLFVVWRDGVWDDTPRPAILRPNEIQAVVELDTVKRAYLIR